MRKQIECPNCESFKTASISPKKIVFAVGAVMTLFGMWAALFIIGIPFLFIGVILMIVSACMKENGKTRCRNCGLIFTNKPTNND